MTIKKGSKVVPITLSKYHISKIEVMCKRMGLSKSAIIQRLIEKQEVFGGAKENLPEKV